MFANKKITADLLFWVQVVFASVFSIPQFLRLLSNTQGQSLSMQIIMLGFVLINLTLSLGAHRINPSRVTRQTIVIYLMWSLYVSGNICAILWNSDYCWARNDSITMGLAILGALTIFCLCKTKGVGFKDPMPKGLLGVTFKAVPQFMMALKVAQEGGAGIPMLTIIAGNITVCTRLLQIWFSVREAKWDRNRSWILINEAMNELSWATVSFVWAVWAFASR